MDETLDRIIELLARWEDRRRDGATLTPEELAPDDLAMQEKLRKRIRRRLNLLAEMEPPPVADPMAETAVRTPPVVPGYELDEVLGSGGMGIVYKAVQRGLNRTVALKMVLTGVGSSTSEINRFRCEAETVAKLSHPNIVQIYEVGQYEGQPYLTLEYVEGGNLAQSLKGTPISSRKAAQLLRTLALAVHHAHEQGVVHRDLKPANILLTASGTPKIADFGLAKRLDDDNGQTRTGTVMGTPNYMSPEQALGRAKMIGPATDLFSLGAILYEMLTGRVPFAGETVLETLDQVRSHDPVSPRQLAPKTPKDLETICLKCLEKVPDQRYGSAQALADDLNAFLKGESIQARPDSPLQQIGRVVVRVENSLANMRKLGHICFWLAPIPTIVQCVMVYWFRSHVHYPQMVILASLVTIASIQGVILQGAREGFLHMPARLRRHIRIVMHANTVASAVAAFAIWWNCPKDRPDLLLLIFPVLMLIVSIVFFSVAADVGYFFLVGAACLTTVVPMSLFLPWSPLVVGVFMTCNIAGQGVFYRTLADSSQQQ